MLYQRPKPGMINFWRSIRETFLVDVRTLSNFGCKVNLFCIYWSMQFSSWILVCVVLERCIKTNFPLRYPRLVTMPRCIMLVLFLTVFLSGVDLHYFWTNGLISEDSEIDCTSLTVGYFNFEEFIFTYVDFCVLSAIPFLLMIGMNMFIIRVIRRSIIQSCKPSFVRYAWVSSIVAGTFEGFHTLTPNDIKITHWANSQGCSHPDIVRPWCPKGRVWPMVYI